MRKGFTLIELLVVVAIIALLAALLFPVFASARESSRQATCHSNRKQIGRAIMLYAGDWDDALPPGAFAGHNPLTGKETAEQAHRLSIGALETYLQERGRGVWFCPSDPRGDLPEGGHDSIGSYIENAQLFGDFSGCETVND